MPAYTSFSGIDIIAVIGGKVIATLQGISYSITREKAPIYTFGSANPRSFSRGKRGLAGSMIFTLFDRSALYTIIADENYKYYAHEADAWTMDDTQESVWDWANKFTTGTQPTGGSTDTIDTVKRHAEYMDQIMPFNINLIAQNEYGYAAWKAILGVEVLNEGGGLSVDDITNEEQTTYVARAATAWVPWSSQDATGNVSIGTQVQSGQVSSFPAASSPLETYKTWLSGGGTST